MQASIDWTVATPIALAISGGLVGLGVLRQKVRALTDRVENLDGKDGRVTKLETAVGGVERVEGEVRSFRENAEARHELVLSEVRHLAELTNERFEGLREALNLRRRASSGGPK